ncbi:MAG TPA: zinc-ribbon domain-containing protein [Methylomirabilota bacterium]|nr:zinc-ribbon domain-containing protein [Methylomirabilota bacterium]
MFCRKCGKELPDDSQFCLKCGHAINASGSASPTKAKSRFLNAGNLIGAILVVLFILWLIGKSSNPGGSILAEGISQITGQPHTQVITNGAITVPALGSSYYKFVVPTGATNVLVDGHFAAAGGMGNDIIVYVLNEDEFTNFQNHRLTPAYYNSGKLTQNSINATLPGGGTYYLVFDNTFSLLSTKAVQANATLHFTN